MKRLLLSFLNPPVLPKLEAPTREVCARRLATRLMVLMTLVPFSSLCVSYTREERREQVNLWIKCLHFFPHVSKGTEWEQISTSDNNDNGDEENLLGLFFDAKVVDHHASKIVVI
jgi:hypothetical protein